MLILQNNSIFAGQKEIREKEETKNRNLTKIIVLECYARLIMTKKKKDLRYRVISFRVNKAELEMIDRVAKKFGCRRADVIRPLLSKRKAPEDNSKIVSLIISQLKEIAVIMEKYAPSVNYAQIVFDLIAIVSFFFSEFKAVNITIPQPEIGRTTFKAAILKDACIVEASGGIMIINMVVFIATLGKEYTVVSRVTWLLELHEGVHIMLKGFEIEEGIIYADAIFPI